MGLHPLSEVGNSVVSANPQVSVILPTFNRAHSLDTAIRSVLAQPQPDIELIIVDDASTDATPQVLAGFAQDPRVRVLRQARNGGVSAARNAGAAAARAPFLAFQDSDDEWLLGRLAPQLAAFEAGNTHRVLVGGTLLRHMGRATITCRWPMYGEAAGAVAIDEERFIASCSAFIQTAVIRREAFAAVGGFDEQIMVCEDYELCLRLLTLGRFAALPRPVVVSYETEGSLSTQFASRHRSLARILDKHAPLFAQRPHTRAFLHYEVGKYQCLTGASRSGRQHALAALRLRPLGLRAYLVLLSSFMGSARFLRLTATFRKLKLRLGAYR